MEVSELKAGIIKILDKGSECPTAVRYHVPRSDGGWDQVSWGDVLERSRQIALFLDDLGVAKDTKVAVFGTTRVEWGFTCPAIEACRAVFVPIHFSSTPDQAHSVIEHCDAEILFTELALFSRVLERWRDYRKLRHVILWDLDSAEQLEQVIAAVNQRNPGLDLSPAEVCRRALPLGHAYAMGARLAAADPDALSRLLDQIEDSDVAAIIYTSGTTGEPKGVVLTIRNLLSSTISWFKVLRHAFPPLGQRRDILWLPISNMPGWGIMGQGTMFEYETWLSDPLSLLRILPEVKPTMLLSVPAYWEKLYSLAQDASPLRERQHAVLHELTGGKLTFLLSGGASLKREVKEFFHGAGIQMIEGYGLTESGANLTMNRLDDFDFDSVGKPMPGVELQLAEDGEILARGDNIFSGYYKDPLATRAVFDDEGWFRTGDLGEWTDRGFLRFKGRKKEILVTSAGKNISPAAIEARFSSRPFVEHVVVYGDDHRYLVALVTLDEEQTLTYASEHGIPGSFAQLTRHPRIHELVQQQINAVNRELPSFQTIKRFHLHDGHLSVEARELTQTLKLRRGKVWTRFRDQLETLYHEGRLPPSAGSLARPRLSN